MGSQTGFIDIKREEPGYRPVRERIKDFEAVEKQLPEEKIIHQAARCMDCGVPFCHGYGCPLANVMPEWNELVFRKKYKEALQSLLSTNPFPEFTGRICPTLCEASCVLGINAEPVTIRQIELFIIEKGFKEGWIKPVDTITRIHRKVAIIGSGPAGLAAADDLNKKGYTVTVFESAAYPGGILRYGIPDYKLEKWVVERRINIMEAEGITFETGIKVGVDVSLNYLQKRFDALCLAGGSRQPRDLPVPGRKLEGVYFAMDYLTQQNRIIGRELKKDKNIISANKKTVTVIGGGDTGADCIGTALRQGAKEVLQLEIMPKPPLTRSASTPWPAWEYMLRTSSSHKEGCERRWSVATDSFKGKSGKVTGLHCKEVIWERDDAGSPLKFTAKPGSSFYIKSDLVLLALGFTGVKKNSMLESFGVRLTDKGTLYKDNYDMTNIKNIFVTGDMSKGASLVVHAIADGKSTAQKIDSYLGNKFGSKHKR
jgi:glutamate synthase (NADPH/NADH) small chain